MSSQFLPKLSRNFIELLDDDEYYDITIEVGEDPNAKIFRAHMNILGYRSPYLRRTLASNKKNNDGILAHIKLPNILPEIFQIILKYIYGGILSLYEQDTSEILKVLIAADELGLQEIVDYLQKYLIENKARWMEQHFEFTQRISFQSNNLLELQQFCRNLITKFPEKLFKSFDFTSLPEKILVQIIKSDDLQMKEIEVWRHVLKWSLAQNPTLLPQNHTLLQSPAAWSDKDFKTMENTLQSCLPLIRFFSLSPKEFSQKVRPYKQLFLKHKVYEDLLNSYIDPDSEPNDNIPLPRNIKIDGIIDSKIVNLNIVSIISRWIDKVEINNKFAYLRELYLPYKFELLLRGSRDGFTPKKFHELCDNKQYTVTFIKVKGTDEILGGYSPIIWASSGDWIKSKDSFIFSFKNRNNLSKDTIILSNVKFINNALWFGLTYGPYFGYDIVIGASDESADYSIYCRKYYYEKKIRDTEDHFSIEDYEVFQIIRQ